MLIFGIDPWTIPSESAGGGIAWINGKKQMGCEKAPKTGKGVNELIIKVIKSERVGNEPVKGYMEQILQFTRKEEQEFECPGCKTNSTCPHCNASLRVACDPKKITIKVTPDHQVFTMSKLYGGFKYLECAFDVRNIPLEIVSAKTWQKVNSIKRPYKMKQIDWKNMLKEKAKFFYPELGKKITLKTADALLIMRHGWIMENQHNFF